MNLIGTFVHRVKDDVVAQAGCIIMNSDAESRLYLVQWFDSETSEPSYRTLMYLSDIAEECRLYGSRQEMEKATRLATHQRTKETAV